MLDGGWWVVGEAKLWDGGWMVDGVWCVVMSGESGQWVVDEWVVSK